MPCILKLSFLSMTETFIKLPVIWGSPLLNLIDTSSKSPRKEMGAKSAAFFAKVASPVSILGIFISIPLFLKFANAEGILKFWLFVYSSRLDNEKNEFSESFTNLTRPLRLSFLEIKVASDKLKYPSKTAPG